MKPQPLKRLVIALYTDKRIPRAQGKLGILVADWRAPPLVRLPLAVSSLLARIAQHAQYGFQVSTIEKT